MTIQLRVPHRPWSQGAIVTSVPLEVRQVPSAGDDGTGATETELSGTGAASAPGAVRTTKLAAAIAARRVTPKRSSHTTSPLAEDRGRSGVRNPANHRSKIRANIWRSNRVSSSRPKGKGKRF